MIDQFLGNFFDIVFLLIFIFFIVWGFFKGFYSIITQFLFLFSGYLVAGSLHDDVALYIGTVITSAKLSSVLGFTFIFLFFIILGKLFSVLVGIALSRKIGVLSRLLGGLLGIFIGGLINYIIVYLVSNYVFILKDELMGAILYPLVSGLDTVLKFTN